MPELTLTEMTDNLAQLMRDRAGVRGKEFSRQIRKAPRVLPRRLRKEAEVLLSAAKVGDNPKLLHTVDRERATLAYVNILEHLEKIDPVDRRKGALINWAASMALNLILIAVAALIVYFVVQ